LGDRSFANMHDISWGTKEGNLQSETRRMHEAKAQQSAKKAEKARAAVEKLQGEAAVLDAKAREAGARGNAPAPAAAGPVPKGGAGMMKVIDDERGIEQYVDYSANNGGDVTLGMTVQDAELVRSIAYANTVTRKLIADAKKAEQAHAESAKREKRMAEELAMDRQTMQTAFNMFRLRMVRARCLRCMPASN
jgi:hypothetical protein